MPDTPLSPLPDKDIDEVFLTRDEAIAELRAVVEQGIASGPGRFESMEHLKREALRRAEQIRRK